MGFVTGIGIKLNRPYLKRFKTNSKIGFWSHARNVIMSTMISVWEKQECLTVIASASKNSFSGTIF